MRTLWAWVAPGICVLAARAVAMPIERVEARIDGASTQTLAATGATWSGANWWEGEFTASVATDQLTVGPHWLEVRMRNSNGVWSAWQGRWMRVVGPDRVAGGEWFIDTDPGPGLGAPISLPADGAWDGSEEDVQTDVPSWTNVAANTRHTAYVRFRNSDGNWGPAVGKTFYVTDPRWRTPAGPCSPWWRRWTNRSEQAILTNAEWFVDEDPGLGQGMPIALPADGAWDEPEEDVQFSTQVATNYESGTRHFGYVRFQNACGDWGPALGQAFLVSDPMRLVAAEWTTNPTNGPGSGSPMQPADGVFDGPDEDLVAYSNTSALPFCQTGTVYVRVQDNYGRWSTRGGYGWSNELARWVFDPVRGWTNTAQDTLDVGPAMPAGPSPVSGTLLTDPLPVLNWSDCGCAAQYTVFLWTEGQSTNQVLAEELTDSICETWDPLLVGQTYFWRIRAIDAAGRSVDGPVWQFTEAHCIEVTAGPNGSISPGTTNVMPHASVRFVVKPNAGYHIRSVTTNGIPAGTPSIVWFTDVTAEQTLRADFEINTYPVAVRIEGRGTVSPNPVAIPHGGSQAFTIGADPGYHVADVMVDGRSIGPTNRYTFVNVRSERTIAVWFAANRYTLTAVQAAHGTIRPSSAEVEHGGRQMFTFIPDSGYRVAAVRVNGVTVPASDHYEFTNVTSNQSLTARFEVMPPAPDFVADTTSGQVPLTVRFANLTTGEASAWEWDFENDGVTDSTARQPPAFTYAGTGSYSVRLRVTGPGGIAATVKTNYITVAAIPLPVAAFTAAPLTGSVPMEAVFTDMSTGDITRREWDFDNNGIVDAVSLSNTVRHLYTRAGVFSVRLTVRGPGGVNSATKVAFINVSVYPPNQDPIAAVREQQIYLSSLGDGADLDASPSSDPDGDDLFYSWREGTGNPVLGLIPIGSQRLSRLQVFFPKPGRYVFGVRVSDGIDVSAEIRWITVYVPGLSGVVNLAPSDVVRLPDVRVAAYATAADAAAGTGPVDVALTDSFGRFTLECLRPAGTNTAQDYFLALSRPGYPAEVQSVTVRSDPGETTLALGRGAAVDLRGRVLDRMGRPVADALVSVMAGIATEPRADTTGADGGFRIAGVPRGCWIVQVQSYTHRSEVRDLDVGPDGTNVEFRLTDEAGSGTLQGRVTLAGSDRPLPDTRLVLGTGAERSAGADGVYRFERLPQGAYILTATRQGYAPQRLPLVVVRAGTNVADVALTPDGATRVEGSVIDGVSGKPVFLATVGIEGPAGLLTCSGVSDRAGYFRLSAASWGYLRFRVAAPGYAAHVFTAYVERGIHLTVSLTRAANWRAPRRPAPDAPRARLAQSTFYPGAMVQAVTLDGSPSTGSGRRYLWRESPDNPAVGLLPQGAESMSRVEIRAFPKPGVYLFELDVAANGAVSAGPAVCTVFVPGLAGNVHRSPSDGVFGLSQGTVRAYSDYGSALNWTDHYLSSRSVAIAPLGDFALDNLATGACWIVAQGVTNASPPYLRYGPVRRVISYGSALGRMAVNISRSEVTFVGTVIDSRTQEPVENVRVAVVAGSLSEIFRTTTDRLGRFVIHAVPAGTQNVLFFADGYQAKTTQFSFSGPKTVKTVPLDPSPSMASAVLCGTVSSRYGGLVLPVAHAEVVLGSGVARTLTDAQGYYEIHGLQAGRIFGTIRKPGYRSTSLSDSLTVTLAPGTNRVDRELAYDGHGPVVRGVIVSDNSEPIPNVTVRVLDAAQKIRSAGSQRTDASEPVVSDAAGTFQLIGLADGDRTLELVFPDGHTRVEEVRVTGNMEWSAIVPTTARDPYAVWLARYYAIPYPTNRLDDTDGDGSTTREEFLWDTVPTNRTSRPPLTALDLGPDGWRLTVTPVSTARWYDAYWKTNLLQRTWWPCGPAQRGAGGPLSWVMTNRPAARRGFFCTGARIP